MINLQDTPSGSPATKTRTEIGIETSVRSMDRFHRAAVVGAVLVAVALTCVATVVVYAVRHWPG